MMKIKRIQRAFVLIEIAIALFVLALVLGGILAPINQQIQQGKVRDTEKAIADIHEALIGFVMINGRLPRPATSATDGRERGTCNTDAACTGFIPWTTLGSPKLDAWGNIIRYSVTPSFADNPFTLTSVVTTATAASKQIIERDSGGVLGQYATGVPVVVWSYGPENFGTNDAGVGRANNSANVTNVDEIFNNNDVANAALVNLPVTYHQFRRRVVTNNPAITGGEFDDIVTFIPTSVLVGKAIAAGKLP